MRAYNCDVCGWTSPGAPGPGWLTLTQHNDADHGGDVTLHYCSTRCCEDDLDSLDLGGADTGHKPGAVHVTPCPECSAQSHSEEHVVAVSQPEKHDPLCRWVNVADLAMYDCDLCDLIARARADERERAVDSLNDAWRESYTNGQGRLSRLDVDWPVRPDERGKP